MRTLYYPLYILKIQHEEDDISVTIIERMRDGEFLKAR